MVNVFHIIYASFYDKTLFDRFVRQGKGWGLPVLTVLAAMSAAVVAVKLYILFGLATPEIITSISQKMPELVIDNGAVVSEEPVFKQVVFTDNLTLTVDTSVTAMPEKMPEPGFYLYKRLFVFVDTNGKVSPLPLESLFGTKKVILTPETTRTFLNDFLPSARKIVPIMVGIVCIPLIFLKWLLLAFLLSLFSLLPLRRFSVEADAGERMRLAILAVTPVVVLTIVLSLLSFRFFGGMLTESVLAGMYIVYYLYPVKKPTEI